MRLILKAFALLLVFFLSSLVKLSHTEDCSTPSSVLNLPRKFAAGICSCYLPEEFATGICRGYLQREFAAGVCRGNLPREFAVPILPWVLCIYKRILFCIYEQILFIWRQTFFICVQNFLICEIFFINSVSSCYCHGSYGLPYLLVQLTSTLTSKVIEGSHKGKNLFFNFWALLLKMYSFDTVTFFSCLVFIQST